MNILLPKRYFTFRSAFGSYHDQNSLKKTRKATEVPIFTEENLKMDLEGRRYWGIEIMNRTEKAERVILGTFPTAL